MTVLLPSTLAHARDLVDPALRAAVDRLDPTSRRLARYHLGWTTADGAQAHAGSGKAIRPALAVLAACAVGGPDTVAVPGAVAVELVHNFSLLHDDLMDGDVERRHRTTVWALWGAPAAILTGDAMLALATQVLLDAGTPEGVAAAGLLADATRQLISGQFDDLAFERRSDVTVEECLAMAAAKTGALLACSAAVGAVLAGADRASVDAVSDYGAELGLAFQLVDDLLGIWGEPDATGKPVGSDLRARKKSLPVTYAMTRGGDAGRELADWLATDGPDTASDIAHAATLVESAGGRAWATEEARRRLVLAERALGRVELLEPPRAELVALGRFVVAREM